jgi:hypothetical protein
MDLVGGQSTSGSLVVVSEEVITKRKNAAASGSAGSGRAILHLAVLHPVCKGLGTIELRSLTKLVHALFARCLVIGRVHLQVVLRLTTTAVRGVESAVASVKDVHFGIRKLRIQVAIDLSVLLTNELGPIQR